MIEKSVPQKSLPKRVEVALENLLFASRWLLAPFYFGLALSLGVLLVKFIGELLHLGATAFTSTESDVILGVLTLVDLALTGSLLIIVIFSGYENFVQDEPLKSCRPAGVDGHDRFRCPEAQAFVVDRRNFGRSAAAAVHVTRRGHSRA